MTKRIIGFMFAALASLTGVNAQIVPVGAVGQDIIGRVFAGIGCTTGQPTGSFTAAIYLPYVAGIPTQFLFKDGATVQNETTAILTGVFSIGSIAQSTNFNITNTFLSPVKVNYYYHPNVTATDWTNFDAFQSGTLVATYQVQTDMFSTVGGVSFGLTTGPFTYSKDFVLPDGTQTNLQTLMPGGITISTISALGTFVTTSGGKPQVVNLSTGTGSVVLGSCAVMIPFSGPGFNPAHPPHGKGNEGDDKAVNTR